jgi:hypothetical protein
MDQRTAFMELSALLTGLYQIVNDPEDKHLNESTADGYLRVIMGEFPDYVPKLLDAYQRLASTVPKPAIDDKLLKKLLAEPEFSAPGQRFVAKQIVNLWYFSQFSTNENDTLGSVVDGGFYERGLVWSLIKAHPIGYSDRPFGYWTEKP